METTINWHVQLLPTKTLFIIIKPFTPYAGQVWPGVLHILLKNYGKLSLRCFPSRLSNIEFLQTRIAPKSNRFLPQNRTPGPLTKGKDLNQWAIILYILDYFPVESNGIDITTRKMQKLAPLNKLKMQMRQQN